MTNIQEIYRKKTKESSKLFAKAKKVHINGVHHNIRFFEPYPFITKSAEGKFLKDVDSNKYVDYWICLLYTSPSPRDGLLSRMPSSA